jgi:hypothetical protein
VYITDERIYKLLPPAGIEAPLDMLQQVSGSYGRQEFLMNVWVRAGESGIAMSLFNSLGVGLGELSYREGDLSFSSPVFPPSFKAEYIIADFQFCFYRIDLLSQALKAAGLTLSVSRDKTEEEGYREFRRIFQGAALLVEIEKTPARVRYINHLRNYAYTLEGDF